MAKKITIVAVVAVLAMGTSAALAFSAGPQAANDATLAQETTTEAEGAQETTMEMQTTAAESANVTFTNQTSNGTAVVVEEVVIPEGGFVVIHNATKVSESMTETGMAETETTEAGTAQTTAMMDGGPEYAAGEVLGNSTYLESGTYQNVTVQLDEGLNESQVLIAMLHQDTNDDQQYDFPDNDDPYTQNDEPVTDWALVTLEDGANETTTAGTETTTEEM